MLKFTLTYKGWEVSERGQIIFSEIRTHQEALAIVRANGLILTEFNDLSTKRAA